MLEAQASFFYYKNVDSQGLRLLTRSQGNMLKTSKWWDKVWTSMLTGENNSLSSEALYTFLLPFLLVLMLLFLARAGFDYFKGDFMQGFNRSVIPIVILSIFLAGNGLAVQGCCLWDTGDDDPGHGLVNGGTDYRSQV